MRSLLVAAGMLCALALHGQTLSAQQPNLLERLNQRRVYPSTSPSESLAAAMQQRKNLERVHAADDTSAPPAAAAPAPSANWSLLGPLAINGSQGAGSLSGRVTAIVTSAKNPNRMYIAAAGGGVWRSEDAGTSWSPVSDTMLSMASGTLVLDERVGAQGTLYYGTGDFTGSTYGIGILRSTDAGLAWQELSTQFENSGGDVLRIALHPSDTQTLFAARSTGVWRTSDGGTNWTKTLGGFASDVVVGQTNPALAFAALGNMFGDTNNGVYRSLDGGATWTLLNALPFGVNAGRISLAATADGKSVLALVANPANFSLAGLYRSDDFGGSWRPLPITPQLFFSQNYNYDRGWFAQTLYIDPANASNIYVGGEQLWRSTNGGVSFTNISQDAGSRQLIHEGIFGIAFQAGSSSNIYVATEGGIYQTLNGGLTWANLNKLLSIAQINAVSVQAGGFGFVAAAESSGIIGLAGDFSGWIQYKPLNSGAAFFDPNNASTIYGGGSQLGPMRSTDGGATWTTSRAGISLNDSIGYYPPFIADPNQAGNTLLGTSRVWRLISWFGSWTAVSPQLTTGQDFLTSLAVATNGRTYAGSSNGKIWASADGATNWQPGSGIGGGLTITSIAADPRSALRAYATMSGFLASHVFRTQDGGLTWQDISGNLPNAPANAVVVDPRGPIYVASDVGVFRTEDATTWTSYNQSLPHTLVTSLALDAASNMLVAGTFGRGVYSIALRAPSANSPAISGIADGASGLLILAPGMTAAMYGTNLLAGKTTVTVNGVNAPILFSSPAQINFQVPFETTTSGAAIVVTTANGSAGAFVQVSPVAPGINASQPATHANGSAVTASNPATAGEVITIAASGLGDTVAGSSTGVAAPAQPSPLLQTVTAFVNGVQGTVTAAGQTPGAYGAYFVNLTVPAVTGNVPLVIVAGGRLSNTVTIAVR